MNRDDAREKFSAAHDCGLGKKELEEFEHALEHDEALRREYEEFRAMMKGLKGLGAATEGEGGGPGSDFGERLSQGVQGKLRARSRGKFYGTRFSERSKPGMFLPLVVVLLIFSGIFC